MSNPRIRPVDVEQYTRQGRRVGELPLAEVIADFRRKARWYACFLAPFLPADKGTAILDVPCGHGNFLWFARQAGYANVVGYDVDPNRVELARRLGLPASTGSATDVVAASRDVGVLVCLDFIEHLEKIEVPGYLSLCHRALRAGGVLLVRTPFTDSIRGAHDLGNDFTHKWAANSGVLLDLVTQAGFEDVVVKDERPVPYKPLNYVRLGVFYAMKSLTNLFLISLGFAPCQVWSTSGWVIGRKP